MSKRLHIIFLISAIIVLIVAWYIGSLKTEQQKLSLLKKDYPSIIIDQKSIEQIFLNQQDSSLTYIAEGEDRGYGGTIKLCVEIDKKANIKSIMVLDHKETHSFFQKIINKKFVNQYYGSNINAFINEYELTDAISGATLSSQAIHHAILEASSKIGKEKFNIDIQYKKETEFKFGLPEIALILLYFIGFYLSFYKIKQIKLIRWFALILSLIAIGFIGRQLLTLSQIGGFMLAFWPDPYEFSFWYLLLFGLIFGITLKGKNYYCDWVCPFGACQEVLGNIGKAKTLKFKFREQLRWFQRMLALAAIVLGLICRNPSMGSYEIFSGLFVFTGSDLLFIVLGIFIVLSLFINKPWCNYLCPIKPSIDYFRKIREIIE